MPVKITRSFVLLIVGTLVALSSWAGIVQAAEYGSIGGRPTQFDPKVPNSASWFLYNLPAGTLKEDAVEVQNNGTAAQDLIVYAADSTPSSDGGFALKQQVETMTGIGAWITFYPDPLPGKYKLDQTGIIGLCNLQPPAPSVTVKKLANDLQAWCQGKKTVEVRPESLSKTKIPFILSIPAQVDVGEHAGAIIIQKKATERQEGQGSAINLTTRVGVRVYETVPGDIVRQLAISRFTVTRSATQPKYILLLGVQNTGNVSLENASTIQVADTFFKRRNEKIDRTMQALPGQELVINTDWPRPFFGRYRFSASVSYKDGDQTRQINATPVVIWIVPWLEVGIGFGVIVLALAGWLLYRRRQRQRYSGKGWKAYTVKKNDDLVELAKARHIDWLTVAKVNKLTPPYSLKVGSSVLLPPVTSNQVKPTTSTSKQATTKHPAKKRSG